MTKSEIAALSDRPLDLAVAEHVFGWRWRKSSKSGKRCLFLPTGWPDWFTTPANGNEPIVSDIESVLSGILPHYSTTGDGLLAVMSQMAELGWSYWLEDTEHYCRFSRSDRPDAEATAETVPMAVCRAALIAVWSNPAYFRVSGSGSESPSSR